MNSDIREGQLMSEDDERRLTQRNASRPLSALITGSKLVNTILLKRTESATALLHAESGLLDALRTRTLVEGRLGRVAEEIEAEGLEMQNRRDEAARKAKTAELQDRIAQEELELRLLQLRKAKADLQQGDATGATSAQQKRLQEAREKAEFERARLILQTKGRIEAVIQLRAERDALIAQVLGGRPLDAADRETRQTVEDIRDLFQTAINSLP